MAEQDRASVGSLVRCTDQHIVVLRWPEQADEARRLSGAGTARLLLVEADADPPEGGDCQQDWVRLPADDRDVRARLCALSEKASRHERSPELDGQGRLLHRGRWVSLSPIDRRLARLLVDRFGSVVANEDLAGCAWERPASSNALRVHLCRLRQRIAPLGLEIRGIRGVGVLLEVRNGDGSA